MMGIYKFTNLINGKIYVGQSISLEKRYNGHYNNHTNPNLKDYDTKFYRALRKYGFDNFSFEIIEDGYSFSKDELNQKEMEWITYYDSYHNGYNSTTGGDKVTENSENHPMAKLTNLEVLEIKKLLKETFVSQYDIAEQFNISQTIISEINSGLKWSAVGINEKYPLRQQGVMRTGTKSARAVFTEEQVNEMRQRYVNETGKQIYKDYEDICSYTTLERALTGKTYTDLPIYKKKDKKWIQN